MRDLLKGTELKLESKEKLTKNFSIWLKNQRLIRGWSQEELASLVKIKREMIYHYESEISLPRSFIMYKIKEIFKQTKHLIKYSKFTVPGQGDAPRGGVRGLRGERG